MAIGRISFDQKDAKFIRKAMDGIGDSIDAKRISGRIKNFLDVQAGKAPSKLDKIAANRAARAEKKNKPKAQKAPAKKAPAAKKANGKAPAKKAAPSKAPAASGSKVTLPTPPKPFDAD